MNIPQGDLALTCLINQRLRDVLWTMVPAILFDVAEIEITQTKPPALVGCCQSQKPICYPLVLSRQLGLVVLRSHADVQILASKPNTHAVGVGSSGHGT